MTLHITRPPRCATRGTPGLGKNPETRYPKFLLSGSTKVRPQIRRPLRHLPSHQTNPTHPIRTAKATETPTPTMGHNINGLHHCATDKQQEKRVMGNNRSPHKDGTFRRLPRHHEHRRPSRPLPPASYKTSQTARQYCIRLRILVYLRLLETSNGSTRDIM